MEYTGIQVPNDNVKLILEKVITKEEFTTCQIDIQVLGAPGDNFVGVLYSVRVQGTKVNENTTLNLIIKTAITDDRVRIQTNTPLCFRNEIIRYKELHPVYEAIQQSANIDKNKRYRFPRFYDADMTYGKECIILGDLREEGFQMENKSQPLSYEYVKNVIENLSKYHALSFVFRDKYEEQYKSIVQRIGDVFSSHVTTQNEFVLHMKKCIERAGKTVDDKDHKIKMERLCETGLKLMKNTHKPWSEPNNVIVHGDAWVNNILFKSENGSLAETILIDYQLAKHCSPVLDVMFLIWICTDGEFREKYFEHMKTTYYESLESFMKELGYDVSKYFTREKMEEDIVEFAPLTLSMTCLNLLIITQERMTLPDYADESAEDQNYAEGNGASAYEKRMGEVIRNFVKYKLI